jgi:hypothetical protein
LEGAGGAAGDDPGTGDNDAMVVIDLGSFDAFVFDPGGAWRCSTRR